MRDAYAAVARAKLGTDDQMVDGLHELLTEEALAFYRVELVLEFLRDFPAANPNRLQELLDAMLAAPATHSEFLALAEQIIAGAVSVDGGRGTCGWRRRSCCRQCGSSPRWRLPRGLGPA